MYYDYDKNKYIYDHTAEEYEQLIRKSPLFSYNKETEISAYTKAAEKMIEYLYNYVVTQNPKNIEFASDIVYTAKKSIDGYDPSKGEFINYFNVWWSNTQKKMAYDQFVDAYAGQKISKSEALAVSKYKKAKEKVLKELNMTEDSTDETARLIAEEMGIAVAKVQKYRWIVASMPISDSGRNKDGEEMSQIELFQGDGVVVGEREKEYRPEDIVLEPYKNIEYYEKLEEAFLSRQLRQQEILKVLITTEFYPVILSDNTVLERIRQYRFFDVETFKECLLKHKQKTHREIADQFERNETSISRTWNEFRKDLGAMLEKNQKRYL